MGPFRTHGLQIIPETSLTLSPARRDSELIVPTNHGAHLYPLTILELKRIFNLHLDQLRLK
jgi:hypothetical protein